VLNKDALLLLSSSSDESPCTTTSSTTSVIVLRWTEPILAKEIARQVVGTVAGAMLSFLLEWVLVIASGRLSKVP
jgi:hypothetical protein